MNKTIVSFTLILVTSLCTSAASAERKTVLVQSTTSTANSGLYDFLLPHFEAETGIKVNVVAVGTGQAIRNASNCDADVLLVHAKDAELEFVSKGFGVERFDLMYNDFVLVGPVQDPAGIKSSKTVTDALQAIAASQAIFVSRGDNSGTHKKELTLWEHSSIDPSSFSGRWYRETGSGMGATLNIAVGMGAYTMTDRATWINFKNRTAHSILVQGDDQLFNQYGITLVDKKACPQSNSESGEQFVQWMTADTGQTLISDYRLNAQQLFYPNANANANQQPPEVLPTSNE